MKEKQPSVTIKNFRIDKETFSERKGEPYRYKNKMYIWVSGETLLENLQNRRNRPYDFYKKEVLPLVMEKIKIKRPEVYKVIKNEKWGWRQSCGCSMCPCSPGFVGEGEDMYTIHIEIK
jgi:hypothetical protein